MSQDNNNNNNNDLNKKVLAKSASTGFKSVSSDPNITGPKPMQESISYSSSNQVGNAYRGAGGTMVANPVAHDAQSDYAHANQAQNIQKGGNVEQKQQEQLYTVPTRVNKGTEVNVLNSVPKAKYESKDDVGIKPWDGLSPLNTYSSSQYSPKEMTSKVKIALDELVLLENFDIDWDKYNDYQYEARTYTLNGELEWRINIFGRGNLSKDGTKSEIEIRRMSGDCFAFGDAESKFIDQLLKNKCIDADQGSDIGILKLNSFQECGFSTTPLPFSMNESDSDVTVDEFTMANAKELISDATNKKQYQSNYSMAVQDLFDSCKISDHISVIKSIDGVIQTLLDSIVDGCFDAFAIKSIIDCVSLLVKAGAKFDKKQAKATVYVIMNKWENTVVNKVGKAEFKFPKSQVITKKCRTLMVLMSKKKQ